MAYLPNSYAVKRSKIRLCHLRETTALPNSVTDSPFLCQLSLQGVLDLFGIGKCFRNIVIKKEF